MAISYGRPAEYAAVHQCALIEGQHLVGVATAEQWETAKVARLAAEKAHEATANDAGSIRTLEGEIKGLQDAAVPLAMRLAEIAREQVVVKEAYLREIAAESAVSYAIATRALVEAFGGIVAANRALAAMDGAQPDLMTPTSDYLAVPALNVPGARAPGGWLANTEAAKQLAPAAFVALKARVAAAGITIPGL